MQNLTNEQWQIVGYYSAILIFAMILGIFAKNRVGFLVGLNLGLTIIIGLWFINGKDTWNKTSK
jgi:hypothetical protein